VLRAGTRSPPTASPRPALLPLQLEGDDFDAASLVVMWAPDHAGGAQGPHPGWVLSVAQRPGEVEASVSALAVRVFMHGWEALAECVRTYQTFAAQARHHFDAGERQRLAFAAAPPAARPPASSAALEGAPAAPRPELSVAVHLHGLVLEAVAAAGRAPPPEREERPVPVACLRARLALHAAQGAAGSRARADLPALLLSLGTAPYASLGQDLRLPLSDALLGVHKASVTLVREEPPPKAEALGEAQERPLTTLAIDVERLSVWAAPRNVSVAAAMAQHAAHMAAPLAAHVAAETDAEKVGPLRAAADVALRTHIARPHPPHAFPLELARRWRGCGSMPTPRGAWSPPLTSAASPSSSAPPRGAARAARRRRCSSCPPSA
jgi:hypothetical protein